MTTLLGGAFAPPIILPLLIIGYLLAYVLASRATNQKTDTGILLTGITMLGWIFITVVIYGLAYMRGTHSQVVFVRLLPWYALWFVYALAITLGAAQATTRRTLKRALKTVEPLTPLWHPTSAGALVVTSHGPTVLESAQGTLDTAQTTLEAAQDTVRTAKTEQAFVADHTRRGDLPTA